MTFRSTYSTVVSVDFAYSLAVAIITESTSTLDNWFVLLNYINSSVEQLSSANTLLKIPWGRRLTLPHLRYAHACNNEHSFVGFPVRLTLKTCLLSTFQHSLFKNRSLSKEEVITAYHMRLLFLCVFMSHPILVSLRRHFFEKWKKIEELTNCCATGAIEKAFPMNLWRLELHFHTLVVLSLATLCKR